MKHTISHDLGQERAKQVALIAWDSYSKRFPHYHPSLEWNSEYKALIGFRAKGIHIKATIDLKPNNIDVDISVPLLLRPFQKRAVSVVEREVNKWIRKAQSGEI